MKVNSLEKNIVMCGRAGKRRTAAGGAPTGQSPRGGGLKTGIQNGAVHL